MGKKRTRKGYKSKGQHGSVSKALARAVRATRTEFQKLEFKMRAWSKGLNPWITIANPSTNQTNKPYIRVRADELWGKPNRGFDMYRKTSED